MYKILIVEDDKNISEEIAKSCELWELQPFGISDFRHIVDEFIRIKPHLIIMDIGLPFFDGFYWTNEIRKISQVPIIFLSSASEEMNIVMAINMGADDFISKPFKSKVLIAKITALLRRTYDFSEEKERILGHKGATLKADEGVLIYGEKKIELTKNELRIMACLLREKGRIVSREKLMESLWETECFIDENTLTVNVNRLRKKLNSIGLEDFIQTKFGQGYTIS